MWNTAVSAVFNLEALMKLWSVYSRMGVSVKLSYACLLSDWDEGVTTNAGWLIGRRVLIED